MCHLRLIRWHLKKAYSMFVQCCYKSARRGKIIRLSSRRFVASFLSSGDRTHCLQSRSSAMGVVTHASSPVERSRPRLWPGHRRRNCAEDAECRHSAEPQRAPGFVQKVKCSHLYFPEETIVECPHGFCVDAHRHRMSSFAGKYESRLSLLEDVRLQRGAAASDPNYFRSGLRAGVNEVLTQ